jgi:hypothetical protein
MNREYAPVLGKARFTCPFQLTSMSELDTPYDATSTATSRSGSLRLALASWFPPASEQTATHLMARVLSADQRSMFTCSLCLSSSVRLRVARCGWYMCSRRYTSS